MQPTTTQPTQNRYVSRMREEFPNNETMDDITLAKIVRAKHFPDETESDFLTHIGLQDKTKTEIKKDVAFEPFVKEEQVQKEPNPLMQHLRQKYDMYKDIDDYTLAKAAKAVHKPELDDAKYYNDLGLDDKFKEERDKAELATMKRIGDAGFGDTWDNKIKPYIPDVTANITSSPDFEGNAIPILKSTREKPKASPTENFVLGGIETVAGLEAGLAKGIGKISGALGFNEFEDNMKVKQQKFNDVKEFAKARIEGNDGEVAGFVGGEVINPLNLVPGGIFIKGSKVARVAKSMAGGAVVGAGTMAAKNYGDDAMTKDEKNLEMGIGAGFVSALNGIIAGVTKGRVTSAINDVPDLEAMRKNPEAYGVTPEEAEQVAVTAQEHLKATKQPKASEELGLTDQPTELDQIDNGFKALADEIMPNKEDEIVPHGMNEPKEIVPEQVTPEPELSKQQQLLNAEAEAKNNLRIAEHRHRIDQPKASEELGLTDQPTELDQIDNGFKALADEIMPNKEDEIVPHGMNEPKEIVPEQVTPEPELSKQQQLLNAEAEAKNNLRIAEHRHRIDQPMEAAVFETQAQQHLDEAQRLRDEIAKEAESVPAQSNIPEQTPEPIIEKPRIGEPEPEAVVKDGLTTQQDDMNVADITETPDAAPFTELLQHPRLEELLTKQQDVLAKDNLYPNKLIQAGAGRELDGNGGTTKHAYDPAQYEKNHGYDFMLTKQDVKNIRAGKIDENIVSKLENDLGVLDNHPDWADVKTLDNPENAVDDFGNTTLFAKGADNLAAGTIAGIEQDENGNFSFDAEKFIIGLGGYTAVKAALKNKTVQGKLKEYAQKAVDTVDMNPAVYKENGLNAMGPVKSKEQKEMRGIYNVQNNGKNSTNIYKDDEFAENYIKYEQGKADYVNKDGKAINGFGALHINKHIGNDKNGWVSEQELLNIGNAIRNTKPIVSKQGGRMYEYHNNDNVRFRAVVGDKKNGERTISFYSNRKAGFGNDSQNYIYNQPLTESPAISKELGKTSDTPTNRTNTGQTLAEADGMTTPSSSKIIPQEVQSYDELFIPDSKFSTAKDTADKSYRPLKQTIAMDGGDRIVGVQKEAPDILVIRDKNGEYATIDKKYLDVKTAEDGMQTVSYKGASDETNPNILMANGSNAFGGGLGGGLIGGMEDTDGNYIPDSWNWRNASIGALAGMGVGHFAKGEGTGMFAGKAFTTTYNKFKAGKLPNASALPDETKLQLSQRKMQDKFNRVKQLINAKADINKIDDVMNPYQANDLMHGRVEERILELETKTFTPILQKIIKSKLTTDQVDEYLWARHAPERNKKMYERTAKPTEMSVEDTEKTLLKYQDSGIKEAIKEAEKNDSSYYGKFSQNNVDEYQRALSEKKLHDANAKINKNGSGMSDAEAYTIINRYANNQAMQDIANDVYKMNRDRLKYIHSEGLESEDFIMMLDANYDNYVPLRREFADKEYRANIGKGFDIKGKETKRAKGSDRTVESPLMHSILAYEETIVRSEKNQVGKAFLEFTKEFPDESLYSVADMKHMPQYDKNGAVVGMSPNYKADDNVFHVKILEEVNKKGVDGKVAIDADGKVIKELKSKVQEITIHDPALAAAFTNMNSQQMSALLSTSQKALRVIASMSTSYNPVFTVTNLARDIQTAMFNMPSEIQGNRLTILKEVFPAMKGIYSSLRGGSKNKWSTIFEEMRKEGGTTGWHDMTNAHSKRASAQIAIDKFNGKVMPKQSFFDFLDYVDTLNSSVENASRLVAYKMAKDSGMTNKKSASIAKNLTVNFNRKGEIGTNMNALYMFYNASIQGTAELTKQLINNKATKYFAGGIALTGFGLDMYNRSVDAEKYAVIDNYIKDTNYIIMNEDGTYKHFPLPYGYNVFKSMGDIASQVIFGELEPKKIPARIISTVVNGFSPIGVDAGSIAHTIAPTLAKPFIEIGENRNFFGGDVAPVQNPYEPAKPDSQNYFKSVNPLAKVAAQKMNELTGGNMYESGWIDVSPESIEHLVEFAGGGLGKVIMNTGAVASQALGKDEKVDINKVPFLSKFYSVPREKAETNIIFKMLEESGKTMYSQLERTRFIKWTDAALEKQDINKDQAKKLKSVFTDNQRRLDFANKYNLQSKDEYQNSETLQDAGRNEGLTKQQRKELLKVDK